MLKMCLHVRPPLSLDRELCWGKEQANLLLLHLLAIPADRYWNLHYDSQPPPESNLLLSSLDLPADSVFGNLCTGRVPFVLNADRMHNLGVLEVELNLLPEGVLETLGPLL